MRHPFGTEYGRVKINLDSLLNEWLAITLQMIRNDL